MSRIIEWVVFDFYGVIALDSTEEIIRQKNDPTITEKITQLNLKKDVGALPLATYIQELSHVLNVSEEHARWLENPVDTYNPEVVSCIRQLKSYGVKFAIASNSYAPSIKQAIEQAGLTTELDCLVSSSVIGWAKPSQAFWESLEKMLNAQPKHCLFIDDRLVNCTAAQAYGFQATHFTSIDVLKKIVADFAAGEYHARIT